jgi:hypothetical protein
MRKAYAPREILLREFSRNDIDRYEQREYKSAFQSHAGLSHRASFSTAGTAGFGNGQQ